MINDLAKSKKYSEISLFADDFKIYKVINDINDQLQLQCDLYQIQVWAKENCFEYNTSKSAVTSFLKHKFVEYSYLLNDQVLVHVNSIKDLGIYFDNTFTFEKHIEFITNKAFRKIGFNQRFSKNFKGPSVYLALFKTLVKPALTHASEIWSPTNNTLCYKIEKTQNRFLKSYSFRIGSPISLDNHNYTDPLQLTNLLTLESTCKYQDVLFLYKIVNLLIHSSELLGLLSWHVRDRLLTQNYKTFNIDSGPNEFMHRNILNRANKLVNEQLNEVDLNLIRISEFKKLLKDIIFSYRTRN